MVRTPRWSKFFCTHRRFCRLKPHGKYLATSEIIGNFSDVSRIFNGLKVKTDIFLESGKIVRNLTNHEYPVIIKKQGRN